MGMYISISEKQSDLFDNVILFLELYHQGNNSNYRKSITQKKKKDVHYMVIYNSKTLEIEHWGNFYQ